MGSRAASNLTPEAAQEGSGSGRWKLLRSALGVLLCRGGSDEADGGLGQLLDRRRRPGEVAVER
eukprot:14139949-Alexandrium_andersonii.AAC.1